MEVCVCVCVCESAYRISEPLCASHNVKMTAALDKLSLYRTEVDVRGRWLDRYRRGIATKSTLDSV